jgi:hypothetical protein
VHIELPKDLGGIQEVGVVDDPVLRRCQHPAASPSHQAFALIATQRHALLNVPTQQRQVEDQGQPVSVDQEQEGQEAVDDDLGDDVGVEAVAEIDRVDVVTVAIVVSIYLVVLCDQVLWATVRDGVMVRRGSQPAPDSFFALKLTTQHLRVLIAASEEEMGRIPFQIAVHDGEEDLQEQVDGVYDDGKEV